MAISNKLQNPMALKVIYEEDVVKALEMASCLGMRISVSGGFVFLEHQYGLDGAYSKNYTFRLLYNEQHPHHLDGLCILEEICFDLNDLIEQKKEKRRLEEIKMNTINAFTEDQLKAFGIK